MSAQNIGKSPYTTYNIATGVIIIFNGSFPVSFCLFSTVNCKYMMIALKFANGWIQTSDLWYLSILSEALRKTFLLTSSKSKNVNILNG